MLTTENANQWVRNFATKIEDRKAYLSEIDSIVGDGDHGNNMSRGMQEAVLQLDAQKPQTLSDVFKVTSIAVMSKVGGASGALYGTAFLEFSKASRYTEDLHELINQAINKMQERGGAKLGDRTLLDVWIPAQNALLNDELSPELLDRAVNKTSKIKAAKGRSSYLGERAIGYPDLGALSSSYLFESLLETPGII